MKTIFTFLLFYIFSLQIGYSQCCSGGSPVGGFTNQGIMTKHNFRAILLYRYSYSDQYYEGSSKYEGITPTKFHYNFTGLNLSYGLTKHLTLDAELGYYINKELEYAYEPPVIYKGWGLTNGALLLKTTIYKKGEFEISGGAGAKFPFSTKPQSVDGVPLPIDAQVSTGAFGAIGHLFIYKGFLKQKLRFFLINRYDYNFAAPPDQYGYIYTYGNRFTTSLFASKAVGTHLIFVAQLRNEWKGKDFYEDGTTKYISEETGGDVIYFSPQVIYSFSKKWNAGMFIDIPVYKYYNSIQLSNKGAFAIMLMRNFNFAASKKTLVTPAENKKS